MRTSTLAGFMLVAVLGSSATALAQDAHSTVTTGDPNKDGHVKIRVSTPRAGGSASLEATVVITAADDENSKADKIARELIRLRNLNNLAYEITYASGTNSIDIKPSGIIGTRGFNVEILEDTTGEGDTLTVVYHPAWTWLEHIWHRILGNSSQTVPADAVASIEVEDARGGGLPRVTIMAVGNAVKTVGDLEAEVVQQLEDLGYTVVSDLDPATGLVILRVIAPGPWNTLVPLTFQISKSDTWSDYFGGFGVAGGPCPADFNLDGFVDGIDYDQFNNAFEAGDPSADYNFDGFVDGIDYDSFNNDFESGC